MQYSEKDLHNQLQYYVRMFDMSKLTEGTSEFPLRVLLREWIDELHDGDDADA
jgi:hypothetical protein